MCGVQRGVNQVWGMVERVNQRGSDPKVGAFLGPSALYHNF